MLLIKEVMLEPPVVLVVALHPETALRVQMEQVQQVKEIMVVLHKLVLEIMAQVVAVALVRLVGME